MKAPIIYAVIIAVHLLALVFLLFPRGNDTGGPEREDDGVPEQREASGEGEEPDPDKPDEPEEPEPEYETYRVRAGDNLSVIARRHNTTISEIKTLNDLQSDIIHPGQELILPSSENSGLN